MKEEGYPRRTIRSAAYGIVGSYLGYFGNALAFRYVDPAYFQFKQKFRSGKIRKKDLAQYWKSNPEAYRFYKRQKSLGDKKTINLMMKKINPAKTTTKINYLSTINREMHNIDETIKYKNKLNFKGSLYDFLKTKKGSAFYSSKVHFSGEPLLRKYVQERAKRFRRVGLPITTGAGIYGAYVGFKKRKK